MLTFISIWNNVFLPVQKVGGQTLGILNVIHVMELVPLAVALMKDIVYHVQLLKYFIIIIV
jgi:hypothetical protein